MPILTNTTAITATFEGSATATKSVPRGTALTATLSVLDSAGAAADLSDFTSITLEVRPHAASGVVLVQETLASGSFTAAPTLPAVHATFSLTDTETNINLGDVASADLHLVVHGIATAGRVTIATGTITFDEDGAGTAGAPATNPDIYYTAAETDIAIQAGGTAHTDLTALGAGLDTAADLIRVWDDSAGDFKTIVADDLPSGGGGAVDSVVGQTGDVTAAQIKTAVDAEADTNFLTDAERATIAAQSGTNTGDQTTIAGITGTKAQFDTAVTDGNIQFVGDAPTAHTHTASEVSDFDTEVANNTDVAANTAARHDAVTVADTAEIDLTLTGQQISGALVASSIDETKLDASVNASLDLADSASQPGHTHDPTTDLTIGSAGAGEQLTVNEAATGLEFGLASKYMAARKGSAGTIAAGTPVFISGFHPGSSSIEIEEADQSDPAKMPATGITKDAVTVSANGRVQISGLETGLDTSTYSEGDPLYVASGGGFTNVKPTTGLIQKIAIVARQNASNGSIELTGAGRANDVPNFSAADKYWYGGTGGVTTEGDITAAGRAILDDADASAQRTTLGVDASGTDNAPAASTTVAGKIEIATQAEVDTGTSTTLAVTPDTLNGWDGTGMVETIAIACSDETTDLASALPAATFRMPYGMTLTDVRASVTTAPTGADIEVDINDDGVSALSTVISIDIGDKSSEGSATQPVIANATVAADSEITIDIDQVGTTVKGAGLKVYLIGTRT